MVLDTVRNAGETAMNSLLTVIAITLTQTVEIEGTNVTLKGTSDAFSQVCGGTNGNECSTSNILVTASTAVA